MDKLEQLAEQEGFEDVDEMLESAVFDSVCPGICTNKGCDYSTEVEPDQDAGWCEECNTPSVSSCLILAEII